MARREYSAFGEADAGVVLHTPEAMFELGLMSCTGREAPYDIVEAHKWFNLAALRGNMDARRCRTEIADEMTSQEVSKAQRLAREWLQLH